MSELIFFYVANILTLGGALTVVIAKNIVYAALGLFVSLLGVAGLFLLGLAQFLALAQILVYGGAIVIVILFALMLTKIEDFRELRDQTHRPIAFLASTFIFTLLTASILLTEVRTAPASEISIEKIGEMLFNQWAIPFEVASIILLVALIGAIVMVRVGQIND